MERLGLKEPPTVPCVVRRTSTLLQDMMGRNSPQIDAYHCAEEGFFNNRVDGGGEMEDVAGLQHQNDVLLQEIMKVSGDYCEEDGVSAIFSNCESTRNMMTGESTGNASSGDSENHGWYKGQKDTSFQERFPTPVVEVGRGTTSSKKMELHVHPSTTGSTTTEAGSFQINFEDYCSGKPKRPRLEKNQKVSSSNIDFRQGRHDGHEADAEAVAHVKEMIYRAAALRPVCLGAYTAEEKPKRRNVRISSDPQTVAARHRRERISERLRVLQKLVPGGSKMDTASMLDEAANYLKFLKSQVSALEGLGKTMGSSVTAAATTTSTSFTAPCNDTSTSTTFLPSLSHAIPGPPSLASQTLIQEHHLATRSSWNVTSR